MSVLFFVLLKFFSNLFYQVNRELGIFTHSLIQFLIDFVDFVEIILVFLFLINIFSHNYFRSNSKIRAHHFCFKDSRTHIVNTLY